MNNIFKKVINIVIWAAAAGLLAYFLLILTNISLNFKVVSVKEKLVFAQEKDINIYI